VVKPATYTIEHTLVNRKKADDLFCYSNIAEHPAMFHAVLFTAQAFHDVSLGEPYGQIAQFHLSRTLYFLQQNLGDKEKATSDVTMSVVTSLAMSSVLLGDVETTKKHMDGLYRMIQWRGGLETLEPGGMVEHKAQR
jgi:hypothetical protein